MNKDKKWMLWVVITSLLCAVWAVFVPSVGMAVLLIANVFLTIYIYKFKLKEE